jgi:hypothetical protein
MTDLTALRIVKSLHTLAWAVFAGAILAMPVLTALGCRRAACLLALLVLGECLLVAANRMRCPLTAVAARYTADRRANFDIYLPEWLARHNILLFGTLYAAGLLGLLADWLLRR